MGQALLPVRSIAIPIRGHHGRTTTAPQNLIDGWLPHIHQLSIWSVGRTVGSAGHPRARARIGSRPGPLIKRPDRGRDHGNLGAKMAKFFYCSNRSGDLSEGRKPPWAGPIRSLCGDIWVERHFVAAWPGGGIGRRQGRLLSRRRKAKRIRNMYNRSKALYEADRMR